MAVERTARVVRVVEHAPDTRSLVLALAEPLVFRPGQFISCLLPIGGERVIRPYSIASEPDDRGELEILFNLVPGGAASRYLFGLRTGETIDFTGPWGTFTLEGPWATETVFIAENTGIAPIRPMMRHAATRAPGGPLTLLYGTTLGVWFAELAGLPGVRGEIVAPERLAGETKRRWVDADDDRTRRFFICGVGPLVHALRDLLRGAGYARRAVQYERW